VSDFYKVPWGDIYQESLNVPKSYAQLQTNVLAQLLAKESNKMPDGTKPVVICGGEIKEAKDLEQAQAYAEELAHSKSANAYILKPVRRVSPKRDVVTTELS
jgi:hypothetical protein